MRARARTRVYNNCVSIEIEQQKRWKHAWAIDAASIAPRHAGCGLRAHRAQFTEKLLIFYNCNPVIQGLRRCLAVQTTLMDD